MAMGLALGSALPATAQPSDIPEHFVPATSTFDYIKRDVMIPMRDGVKLHTVIVVPKGAKNAPILLTRTPYGASSSTAKAQAPAAGSFRWWRKPRRWRWRRSLTHIASRCGRLPAPRR